MTGVGLQPLVGTADMEKVEGRTRRTRGIEHHAVRPSDVAFELLGAETTARRSVGGEEHAGRAGLDAVHGEHGEALRDDLESRRGGLRIFLQMRADAAEGQVAEIQRSAAVVVRGREGVEHRDDHQCLVADRIEDRLHAIEAREPAARVARLGA